MDKNDIYVLIAFILCAVSFLCNTAVLVNSMYRKPRRFYTISIDAPTVNVWKEEVHHEHLEDNDIDRDFDIKYDLIDEKDAKCK